MTAVRACALPLVAAALVVAVLGTQLAYAGGDFVPAKPANPCAARPAATVSKGIDGLSERLVLLGLDAAACRLGLTREALALQLAQQKQPTNAQVAAVRAGLLAAIARMKTDHSLPPASDLIDDALDRSDLPGFVKSVIRALPDSVVDAALKTDDVLRRMVKDLDIRRLLTNLRDPDKLEQQIDAAVTEAVQQSLLHRLRSLI